MRSKVTSIAHIILLGNVKSDIMRIPVGNTVCYTIRIETLEKQTCFSHREISHQVIWSTVLSFVFYLSGLFLSQHTWNFNEVLFISADVRTPKTVNLKVIAPRVNSSFYFTNMFFFCLFLFLPVLSIKSYQ